MFTGLHKKVADKMIAEFKKLDGVEQVRDTIVYWFIDSQPRPTPSIIYYVLESLVLKGYLFKSEMDIYGPNDVGEPRLLSFEQGMGLREL